MSDWAADYEWADIYNRIKAKEMEIKSIETEIEELESYRIEVQNNHIELLWHLYSPQQEDQFWRLWQTAKYELECLTLLLRQAEAAHEETLQIATSIENFKNDYNKIERIYNLYITLSKIRTVSDFQKNKIEDEIEILENSISYIESLLQEYRDELAVTTDSARQTQLEKAISDTEPALIDKQEELAIKQSELDEIEKLIADSIERQSEIDAINNEINSLLPLKISFSTCAINKFNTFFAAVSSEITSQYHIVNLTLYLNEIFKEARP